MDINHSTLNELIFEGNHLVKDKKNTEIEGFLFSIIEDLKIKEF